jgi:uridine kinase
MNQVIAISGFPGAGKSSLMSNLSEHISAVLLQYDDYQTITERPVEEISSWMQEGADYNDFVIPKLAEDLGKLKTGESITYSASNQIISPADYIIFETPLGREHEASGYYIDVLVWIELPLDVALARNLKSFNNIFLMHEHVQQLKDDLSWMDMYLVNYVEHVRSMLILQRDRLMNSADIIIDGEATLEAMTTELLKALS